MHDRMQCPALRCIAFARADAAEVGLSGASVRWFSTPMGWRGGGCCWMVVVGGFPSRPPYVRVPAWWVLQPGLAPVGGVPFQAELRLFETIQEGGSGRTGGVPGRMRARTGTGEGVGGAHTGENLEDRAFAAC